MITLLLGHIAALARSGQLLQQSSMVCQLVTTASPAKTAELIEMLFGMWIRPSGGPKEASITWGPVKN